MKKLYYEPKKCTACRTCEISCAIGHCPSKDLYTAILEDNLPVPSVRVYPSLFKDKDIALKGGGPNTANDENYPVACRHCRDYPCVNSCIACALKYDPIQGIIFDKEKCVGCWMCIMACPYGAVKINRRDNKSVRCDFCADIKEPRCARDCPTKAIIYKEEKE